MRKVALDFLFIGCGVRARRCRANIAQAAEMESAHPMLGVDILGGKLEMAKRLGTKHALNSTNVEDSSAEIPKLVGAGGADVVIDTTGNKCLSEQPYYLTHADGKTNLVGVPKKVDTISIYSLLRHLKKILTGFHVGSAEPYLNFSRYILFLQAGKYKLDALVTHECKVDHIKKAIAVVWRGDEGRVLVAME